MKLSRMVELLEAEVLCGQENLEMEIPLAVAGDMMSDILAYTDSDRVLLTGLCTPHAVRTASILDISAIIFVRAKTPTSEMIEDAQDSGITLIRTAYTMYAACATLHENGLEGRRRVDV